MEPITLASGEDDARAVEAIERHHAELAAGLATRVEAVVDAVARGDHRSTEAAVEALTAWCHAELEPHTQAEDATLYRVARERPDTALLARALSHEHGLLTALVGRLGQGADGVRPAGEAIALHVLFDSHVAKENELMVPALAADPGVSLAGLLEESHPPRPTTAGHACGCGETHVDGEPELDARTVPHAIRHATVLGALAGVQAGGGLVLVAPHDPLPLLDEIEQRHPGVFEVGYLERGPEVWRLRFRRRAA